MDFFRLRVTNTLLVFFIGGILGYMIKERLDRRQEGRYVPVYPRVSAAPPQAPADVSAIALATAEGPAIPAAKNPAFTGPAVPPPDARTDEDGEEYASPVNPGPERRTKGASVVPADPAPGDSVSQRESGRGTDASGGEADYVVTYGDSRAFAGPPAYAAAETGNDVVSGAEDAFFKNPELYAGRDLKMEIQMILARKTQGGWRLNFVHTRGGKNVDYVYIDDDSMLGEKPELKIGYFYNVVFKCAKGELNSGNRLLGLTPSSNKAAWATGVSAIE